MDNSNEVILQFDKNGKFVREWKNLSEIYKELRYNTAYIRKCCEYRNDLYKDSRWVYKEDYLLWSGDTAKTEKE